MEKRQIYSRESRSVAYSDYEGHKVRGIKFAVIANGYDVSCQNDENQIMVMVTQLYKHTATHLIVRFNWVYFMVYKLFQQSFFIKERKSL